MRMIFPHIKQQIDPTALNNSPRILLNLIKTFPSTDDRLGEALRGGVGGGVHGSWLASRAKRL